VSVTLPLPCTTTRTPATLVDVLEQRAVRQPDEKIYTFLHGDEQSSLTHRQLDERARSLASILVDRCRLGDRVLLLYPPGLDYIVALYACMCAGVIAVPAYAPRPNRSLARLESIIADAQPTIALTSEELLNSPRSVFRQQTSPVSQLSHLATDRIPFSAFGELQRRPSADSPVILQYTSGSTASPRGVVLTHANILHNTAMIQENFPLGPESSTVFWLPPYHDMGLIGGILQPLRTGFPVYLMSPVAFLQRPIRWLQAISRFRATCSGGPNFAYDLCVQRISPDELEGLDLSSWTVAFSGAEPIRRETLEEFSETFARCGFRRSSLHPCYGLAEATLMATGIEAGTGPRYLPVSRTALEENRVEPSGAGNDECVLVSCGKAACDQEVRIVDPATGAPSSGGIGEVWISGPSVARGYWERPQETEETFLACLSDGTGPFLRTGDLGFIGDGELYITGRIKDLIIIHGQNHYPQDIEFAAQRSHPALKPSSSAAFSVERDGAEQLVLVQEVDVRSGDEELHEITTRLRRAVSETYDLQVDILVYVRAWTIPRTTSGKIQRYLCRAAYLAGTLDIVG
jgi:acyl-CoA synthetase (AMP-forming)/AMP-acid ligase II